MTTIFNFFTAQRFCLLLAMFALFSLGCGVYHKDSHDNEATTYVNQLTDIWLKYTDQIAAVFNKELPDTNKVKSGSNEFFAQLAQASVDGGVLADKELLELQNLTPPSRASQEHAAFLDYQRQIREHLRSIESGAKAQNLNQIADAGQWMANIGEVNGRLITDLKTALGRDGDSINVSVTPVPLQASGTNNSSYGNQISGAMDTVNKAEDAWEASVKSIPSNVAQLPIEQRIAALLKTKPLLIDLYNAASSARMVFQNSTPPELCKQFHAKVFQSLQLMEDGTLEAKMAFDSLPQGPNGDYSQFFTHLSKSSDLLTQSDGLRAATEPLLKDCKL